MAHDQVPDVFVVTSQGGAGLTRRQTQSMRYRTPTPGVRVRRDAERTATRAADLAILVALAARPRGTVVTDLSAAWVWRLPLPPWLRDGPGAVSLSVPAGQSHTRRAGIRGRRLDLPDEHVTEHRGIPVTTASRTWLDCAASLPPGHLLALGDAVLHRALATPDDLRAICHWAYRRRGVATARRLLPLLDGRAESPGESLARYVLVSAGLPVPECNVDVIVDGSWLARVDLLWRRERVVVEYDGIVHLPERQRQYDALRRNRLQEAGFTVVVLTARDLRHPQELVQTVRAALSRRPLR